MSDTQISKDDKRNIIKVMNMAGYYYDEYASTQDNLRFTTDLGVAMYFKSWEEAMDWISNVVIDDPVLIDEIQRTFSPSFSGQKSSTYEIYQLKDIPQNQDIQYMQMSYLKSKGITSASGNYDLVYSSKLDEGETLEDIYVQFNLHCPSDYHGHSLSVSDVVVIYQNNERIPFYVDAIGFTKIPDFFSNETENSKEKAEIENEN